MRSIVARSTRCILARALTSSKTFLCHQRQAHTSVAAAALRTHGRLIKTGAAADIYSWNSVLTLYGRLRALDDACRLFDEIPGRDTASWNTLISAHVSRGEPRAAQEIFLSMMRRAVPFDTYTLGSILKSAACGGGWIELTHQLHSLVAKAGLGGEVYSGSALLSLYAKCGRVRDAELVFRRIRVPNVVSWNALIDGHAQVGNRAEAFQLFHRMQLEGIPPDEATFASMLILLDTPGLLNELLQLHSKIIKHGWTRDTIACNAAITSYSQCGMIEDAEKVFHSMNGFRDSVTWNSLLAAFIFDNLATKALELFVHMMRDGIKQDMYTYTTMISACFEDKQLGLQGRSVHGLAVKKGLDTTLTVSNSLIVMYLKSCNDGSMEEALKCFNAMEFRDHVSWNSVLTGLSQCGHSEEAMKFFRRMQLENSQIDHFACSAALRSCSDSAVLELGMQVHSFVVKSGCVINEFVVSSLVNMYSKSGVIIDAIRVFDESLKGSSVTWNSIIFAFAQHGQGRIALDLFSEMQQLQIAPDHITFVGILSACSHIGLVEKGIRIMEDMERVYRMPLRMEHYACGVDLFGRAGRIAEATRLIDSMPYEPDAMVWITLLSACRIHRDVDLASKIAEKLLTLQPAEHSTYVLLCNMYSGLKLWEGRAVVHRAMRDRGVSKVPGWSWIEVNNMVHSFIAEDLFHPQAKNIYSSLRELTDAIGRESDNEGFTIC